MEKLYVCIRRALPTREALAEAIESCDPAIFSTELDIEWLEEFCTVYDTDDLIELCLPYQHFLCVYPDSGKLTFREGHCDALHISADEEEHDIVYLYSWSKALSEVAAAKDPKWVQKKAWSDIQNAVCPAKEVMERIAEVIRTDDKVWERIIRRWTGMVGTIS